MDCISFQDLFHCHIVSNSFLFSLTLFSHFEPCGGFYSVFFFLICLHPLDIVSWEYSISLYRLRCLWTVIECFSKITGCFCFLFLIPFRICATCGLRCVIWYTRYIRNSLCCGIHVAHVRNIENVWYECCLKTAMLLYIWGLNCFCKFFLI